MNPAAADPPCVIQALPAHSMALSSPPPLVQALPAQQSPAKAHPPLAAAASPAGPKPRPPPPPPPSPRRTRSGGAPEWTAAETLALVAEVAAVDDGWSRSVSAFQKWAMVAENLAASASWGPARRRGSSKRAAAECRRRWEALAAEYGSVRRWEVRTGGRYWEMTPAARRKAGLPVEFDAEVYGAMDALIRVEEALLADAAGGGGGAEEVEGLVGGGAGVEVGEKDGGHEGEVGEEEVNEDGTVEEAEGEENEEGDDDDDEEGENEEGDDEEEEEQEEMQVDGGNADASDDPEGHQVGTNSEPDKSQNTWELANKLQGNAQHIHTILSEEADEAAGQNPSLAGAVSPDAMEITRQKADELIKSLGGLVSYLNQFTELVKENGFESMVGMT
ncbi:hypothetical protein HU200_040337 [Digitaria exilis]|uniref:Myb-like domain-containing protein n=1 Tax=Digitaria exilis TaxID=1010633 RepID=A0A835B8J6_9POAL|nr:hypothetical protein HU200_040337 [Digitaria exilis]